MNKISKGKAGCESCVCSRIATMTITLSSARDLQRIAGSTLPGCLYGNADAVSLLALPLALGEAACFRCLYHLEAGFS